MSESRRLLSLWYAALIPGTLFAIAIWVDILAR